VAYIGVSIGCLINWLIESDDVIQIVAAPKRIAGYAISLPVMNCRDEKELAKDNTGCSTGSAWRPPALVTRMIKKRMKNDSTEPSGFARAARYLWACGPSANTISV
jgi:hypothetical protein